MAFKTFFAVCALAAVQSVIAIPSLGLPGIAPLGGLAALGGAPLGGLGGIGGGCGCGGVASTGGNLPIASASVAPRGISVQSDNAYEGKLCLGGNLPFLGSVALQGVLPTQGSSRVSYGCGNGQVGITGERGANTGIAKPGSYQPGPGALKCGGCGAGGLW